MERLNYANELFDHRPFLLSKSKGERPSVSMYDAVMVALDRLWDERGNLIDAKSDVQTAYWAALDSAEKVEQFTGRANTSSDVKARIDAMEQIFAGAI